MGDSRLRIDLVFRGQNQIFKELIARLNKLTIRQRGEGKYLVLKESEQADSVQIRVDDAMHKIRQSKMKTDKMNQSRDRMYRSLSKRK